MGSFTFLSHPKVKERSTISSAAPAVWMMGRFLSYVELCTLNHVIQFA
jgi:hypothetical protein